MTVTTRQFALLAIASMIGLPGAQAFGQPSTEGPAASRSVNVDGGQANGGDQQPQSPPRGSTTMPPPERDWPFDDCGELIQGVECVLFQADSWGLFVLENYGTFSVGDRVHVVGIYDPFCITFCMQGDGCIIDNSISLCCPADVNGDGVVDVLDLLAVIAAWGAGGGPEDVNGDGVVDVLDLLLVIAAWGAC